MLIISQIGPRCFRASWKGELFVRWITNAFGEVIWIMDATGVVFDEHNPDARPVRPYRPDPDRGIVRCSYAKW